MCFGSGAPKKDTRTDTEKYGDLPRVSINGQVRENPLYRDTDPEKLKRARSLLVRY